MKIACDLDDCLVAACKEVLDLTNEQTGNNFKFEDLVSWKLERTFDLPTDIILPIVHEVLSRHYLPPMPGAVGTLNRLYAGNAWKEFFIVTHRRPDNRENTENLCNFLGLNFPFTLELVGENERGVPAKAEYIQKHNIDLLIEDRFDTAIDVARETKAHVLLMNKPWNIQETIPIELCGKMAGYEDWYEIGYSIKTYKQLFDILEKANEKTHT